MKRCIFTVIAFGLAIAPALAGGSAKTSLTGPMAERFNAISDRLVCQCNCRMILGVCNHQNCPSGIPMREEIESKLLQGAGDDAIVEGFVGRIGKAVLSAPPRHGGYLLVWIMPFLVLAAGGVATVFCLRNMNRKRKQWNPPSH